MSKALKIAAGLVLLAVVTLLTARSCRAGDPVSLPAKAAEALDYCRRNKMDTTFCILIDMGVHSGLNRIFVWDFQKNATSHRGLCCHGMGRGSTGSEPVFSNDNGSYCTSLGKYKLGARSWSQWGINVHYKMHGQEPTNSNAYKRIVVFHSHTPVPSFEIWPAHLPLGYSLGCPVVSNDFMRTVDPLLSAAGRPVLMWIYR